MKLVIAKPSPFARKVRVALREKGIAFEENFARLEARPSFAATRPEPQPVATGR